MVHLGLWSQAFLKLFFPLKVYMESKYGTEKYLKDSYSLQLDTTP